MRRRVALAVIAVLAVVACEGASSSTTSGATRIEGRAVAGPVCPVERPGDPACAPRPVVGAQVVIQDEAGHEIATVTTNADGRFVVAVPQGRYTVTALPVEGLMRSPAPVEVDVSDADAAVELSYDTGIR